jgi:formylglycine-generating enzyme required for sulfatase activity
MDAVEGHKCSPRLLQMCLEHERMHQETLMYMLTQARRAEWERDPPAKLPGAVALPQDWAKKWERPSVRVPAGRVVMGVDATEAGAFVWDNEGPPFETKVPLDFMVASEPVTVGQWRNFIVEKKGYDMDQWWDAADLAFFRSNGLSQPATWSRVKGDFYIHRPEGVFHWTQIANEPVLVSLTEALAFCKSLGYRIMSETEYQRVLDSDKQGRVKQLREGGWEWTSSHFAPFPGFKPMPEYPEYSTDFFDDCHFVLRGSSLVTHPSLKRDSFRNYYQKQYPYMFAKFRLCSSVHSVAGG